jgi:hypothetical protein
MVSAGSQVWVWQARLSAWPRWMVVVEMALPTRRIPPMRVALEEREQKDEEPR